MSMTVGHLKELLEDFDDAVEVRLLTQRHYPLESSVYGVTCATEIARTEIEYGAEDTEGKLDGVDSMTEVVYLTEGAQIGYGNRAAWELATR